LRIYKNRVLRRICGPKTEEVVGGWRRLHNEDHHNLYASLNIIQVINLSRMRWVGCSKYGRDEKYIYYFGLKT
jgi:hypothetical protein